MFVGVVVENFHRCRAEQEKEERARRAAKRAKKIEERRRSKYFSDYWDILLRGTLVLPNLKNKNRMLLVYC